MLETQGREDSAYGEAADHMMQALGQLRLAGHQELVVRGLLASAELHRLMAEFDQAEAELEEATANAARGQMRLHLADANLQYAYLRLALGRPALARECFGRARQLIQEMGYHCRDRDVQWLQVRLGSQ